MDGVGILSLAMARTWSRICSCVSCGLGSNVQALSTSRPRDQPSDPRRSMPCETRLAYNTSPFDSDTIVTRRGLGPLGRRPSSLVPVLRLPRGSSGAVHLRSPRLTAEPCSHVTFSWGSRGSWGTRETRWFPWVSFTRSCEYSIDRCKLAVPK